MEVTDHGPLSRRMSAVRVEVGGSSGVIRFRSVPSTRSCPEVGLGSSTKTVDNGRCHAIPLARFSTMKARCRLGLIN